VPVRASEDVSFEEKFRSRYREGGERGRIRYYRNPWPSRHLAKPKKDSMGMDYIPAMKASRTTIHRSRSAPQAAKSRCSDRGCGAPYPEHDGSRAGHRSGDERRKASYRCVSKASSITVENVTTGTHVHKGQRLMRIYGPSLSSAAAISVGAHARPDTGIGNQALKGARRRLENLGAPEAFIAEIERTREVPVYVSWPRRRTARSWSA